LGHREGQSPRFERGFRETLVWYLCVISHAHRTLLLRMGSRTIFFDIVEDSWLSTNASLRVCWMRTYCSLASFKRSHILLQKLFFGWPLITLGLRLVCGCWPCLEPVSASDVLRTVAMLRCSVLLWYFKLNLLLRDRFSATTIKFVGTLCWGTSLLIRFLVLRVDLSEFCCHYRSLLVPRLDMALDVVRPTHVLTSFEWALDYCMESVGARWI